QLNRVIQRELKDVQRKYANSRRSIIEPEVETIEVDLSVLGPSEDVIVSVTKDGYVKRTSVRSYSASNGEGMDMKESDYLLYVAPLNTQHHLLLFTSLGNYMYQPVHELPDIRWKDLGQHLSSIISLAPNEE
ncbi:DNA gyrase C-terminal beta-propeller domain-containing protein, partial [Enterococcus faecium]|uniref:DNA gyrase C-terminal beta-propeller domain-containing protein n=1 Tax=Enterococcus faecium TaxID=1352 RepID=UPI002811FD3A